MSANVDGLAISRLSHSTRDGDIAQFDFYWSVGRGPALTEAGIQGDDGSGVGDQRAVKQWTERHRLALWTDAQYRDAFRGAGLDVEHDSEGLIGRGLYLAHMPLG